MYCGMAKIRLTSIGLHEVPELSPQFITDEVDVSGPKVFIPNVRS